MEIRKSICPYCGSDDVEAFAECDGLTNWEIQVQMICHKCNHYFEEIYTFTHIIKEEENKNERTT